MTTPVTLTRRAGLAAACWLALTAFSGFSGAALAQSGGFAQALAQTVARDGDLSAYYKATNYQPLFVGGGSARQRVSALNDAIARAADHALPAGQYNLAGLQAKAQAASGDAGLAAMEAAYARAFLDYAADVQSGILTPSRAAPGIERSAPRRDPVRTLISFAKSSPRGFIDALPPGSAEYRNLLKEKDALERAIGRGGWGPKVGGQLKSGQSGNQVAALRSRLSAMGYRAGSGSAYDQTVVQAVAQFQRDNGLTADGAVGAGTLQEINREPQDRLASVVVAMERERWMNFPRGQRHVWVNIPDFTASIIDNDTTTFQTRAVVGQNAADHRSPEFTDTMEFMVVNPTWNVPRSILVKEYLPMLRANPNSVGNLQLVDGSGRVVSRSSVDYSAYSEGNFPYSLREPPSDGNALGVVKFMFPNAHNIYLHDTPSKSLFNRESRAFSHGCIRLQQPLDFAYTLLAPQTGDPKGHFQSVQKTGRESTIRLDRPIPVHLDYRTAFTQEDGRIGYRRDVYGRDAQIFRNLQQAGVSLRSVRG